MRFWSIWHYMISVINPSIFYWFSNFNCIDSKLNLYQILFINAINSWITVAFVGPWYWYDIIVRLYKPWKYSSTKPSISELTIDLTPKLNWNLCINLRISLNIFGWFKTNSRFAYSCWFWATPQKLVMIFLTKFAVKTPLVCLF